MNTLDQQTSFGADSEPSAEYSRDAHAKRALAPEPALESPRLVIRGESFPTERQESEKNGNPNAAFTDWLNITFPLPDHRKSVKSFFDSLSEAIGSAFGAMEDRGRGLHGYQQSYRFERGGVLFACGGQRQTGFLSIPGEGCSLIPYWPAVVELFRSELQGRISRWDGAADDLQGRHSVDEAVALYRAGAFNGGGRKPSCGQAGNWIDPDGTGRTLYIGRRKNGKMLRVYEKGMQLGAAWSPWVRWEVELHSVDRVIPWEVLLEPGRYVAGAYPALSWVTEDSLRIDTLRKTDAISLERLIHYGRLTYGPLLNTLRARGASDESILRQLIRPGVPKRLELTEHLHAYESQSDEL
jgi:phage replication initiation protein